MKTLEELTVLEGIEIPEIKFFEKEEYEERLQKVRVSMAEAKIDLMILTRLENLRYFTGFHTFARTPQFLLVPTEGEIIHVLRYLEAFLSRVYSILPPKNVVFYDDTENPLDVVTEQVNGMGLERAVIGIEGSHMSDLFKHRLSHPEHNRLYKATWRHLDGDLWESVVESVRDVKSENELDYIRQAGKISVEGAHSGIAAVRGEATDNEVAAAIAVALLRSGSEPLPHSPIVTSGWRAGIPHTTFERQTIREGDTVLIEHAGVYAGYVAPIMRSVSVGQPNNKVREMSDVLMEALHAALGKVKPGVTSGEVDAACRGVIEKAGYYENFRKRTGYSFGLSWPEHISLAKDDPTVLKAGMAFHIPVALRDYGKAVVGFSPAIAVTEDGYEVVTELPDGIVIKE